MSTYYIKLKREVTEEVVVVVQAEDEETAQKDAVWNRGTLVIKETRKLKAPQILEVKKGK